VVLARGDDPLHASFGEAFFRGLVFNGKPAVDNGSAYQEIVIPARAPTAPELGSLANAIVAAEPSFVVLAGSYLATVPLIGEIEGRAAAARLHPTYVVASDSSELFAPFLGSNVGRRRRFFAVQSLSNTVANARFVMRYNEAHPTAPVSRETNPASTYDAFYLLAYGAFALGTEAPSGAALARAFGRLLPPGPAIEVGPSDLDRGLESLATSGRVDLVGTQSGLDLDAETGETPSDFALLCAAIDGHGRATGEDVESGVVYRARARAVDGTLGCP
jgi:hypothetical protein